MMMCLSSSGTFSCLCRSSAPLRESQNMSLWLGSSVLKFFLECRNPRSLWPSEQRSSPGSMVIRVSGLYETFSSMMGQGMGLKGVAMSANDENLVGTLLIVSRSSFVGLKFGQGPHGFVQDNGSLAEQRLIDIGSRQTTSSFQIDRLDGISAFRGYHHEAAD